MKLTMISLKSLEEIAAPELSSDEVHLWCVFESVWRDLETTGKVSREILARVLSVYLRRSESVDLEVYGEGKLRVISSQNEQGIHFNLSHSEGLLVIAVTRMGEIGVDVEKLRAMERIEQISERFFFPSERKVIQAAAELEKNKTFFQIWTAKEAWAKLHATSVFRSFQKFELKPLHYSSVTDQHASYVGSVFTRENFVSFSL